MTTPAQKARLVIGKEYRVKGGDEHAIIHGSIVTFSADDRSSQPKFTCRVQDSKNSYDYDYIYIHNVEPLVKSGVEFAASTRTIETTVITVDRKLTDAEQAEIEAIIVKGNK